MSNLTVYLVTEWVAYESMEVLGIFDSFNKAKHFVMSKGDEFEEVKENEEAGTISAVHTSGFSGISVTPWEVK